MLSTSSVRLLGERDLGDVLRVLHQNPVANAFVESRVLAAGGRTWRMGGELWGFFEDDTLQSLCYSGANLVPAEATERALLAFADRALRNGRRCSSIVGRADDVLSLWSMLEPEWGPAREVRANQPLLAIDEAPLVSPDPKVRRVEPDEIDLLVPASIAMFTEEVGVSPLLHDGGALYRARIAELVHSGRAFARIEDGCVVFKAEIGAVTDTVCQAQGVWVDPRRRGEGISIAGMAAVVALAQQSLAPVVSLYVNHFNAAALRAYDRVGFREVGIFATILF